ncbi:MAG: hypothetical protein QOE70_1873 [Chthoniobacter sp.]|jgi:hypothetical protein|nr:hypothetical protein [Chthoniobacter sp.]
MIHRRPLFVVLAIGIAVIATWLIRSLNQPVAKLSIGQCEFRLFIEKADFDMPTYYRAFVCEVWVAGRLAVKRNQFAMSGASFSELAFSLIESPDKQVVALIEKSDPDVVLAVYALDTRETYPAGSMLETPSEGVARGKRLIDRVDAGRLTLRELLKGRSTRL